MHTMIIVGCKGGLSVQVAQNRAPQIVAVVNATAPHELVEFAVEGFDNDSRELWDIPESRDYLIALIEALVRHGVKLEHILPQTLRMIELCYAVRAGRPVIVQGTVADAVREGVEQILQHRRTHLH